MPLTTGSYQKRVTSLDWDGLRTLWSEIERRNTPGWEPGRAFEYLILRAFELEGARVTWPYEASVMDHAVEQIDGALYLDGLSCLVESKDTGHAVAIEPVSKLRHQLARRPAGTLGLLFSRQGFTQPAVVLANFTAPHAILLWSGGEVGFLLEERGFRRALAIKYRRLVEHGQATYTVRELEP